MYHVNSCDIEYRDAPLYTQPVQYLTFPKGNRIEDISDEIEEPDRFLVLFIPQRYLHLVVIELRYTIPSHKHDEYRRILEIEQIRLNLATFGEKFRYLSN
jgi:hypothetical protein